MKELKEAQQKVKRQGERDEEERVEEEKPEKEGRGETKAKPPKLLHMTINFTSRVKIACHMEQIYDVKQ